MIPDRTTAHRPSTRNTPRLRCRCPTTACSVHPCGRHRSPSSMKSPSSTVTKLFLLLRPPDVDVIADMIGKRAAIPGFQSTLLPSPQLCGWNGHRHSLISPGAMEHGHSMANFDSSEKRKKNGRIHCGFFADIYNTRADFRGLVLKIGEVVRAGIQKEHSHAHAPEGPPMMSAMGPLRSPYHQDQAR